MEMEETVWNGPYQTHLPVDVSLTETRDDEENVGLEVQ